MVVCIEDDRYPHKLVRQVWNIKPRRGGQRKSCRRVVDDLVNMKKSNWSSHFLGRQGRIQEGGWGGVATLCSLPGIKHRSRAQYALSL